MNWFKNPFVKKNVWCNDRESNFFVPTINIHVSKKSSVINKRIKAQISNSIITKTIRIFKKCP